MKRLVVSLLVVGSAVAFGACGDSSDSGGSAPPPTNPPIVVVDVRGKPAVDVNAKDDVFEPNGVQIDTGTTVTWHNVGNNVHNVLPTSDGVSFGAAPFGAQADKFGPGATYSYTFGTPGTFDYTCTLHTGMNGRVVVG